MDIDILKNKLILLIFPILGLIIVPIILLCLDAVPANVNNILIIVGCWVCVISLIFIWLRQLFLIKFYSYRNSKKMYALMKYFPVNILNVVLYFGSLTVAGSLLTSSLINKWLGNSGDMWFLFVVISLCFIAGLYIAFSNLFNVFQDINKQNPFFVKFIGYDFLENEKVYIAKFTLIPQNESEIALKNMLLKQPKNITINDYDKIRGFYKNGVLQCLLDDVSKFNSDDKLLLIGRIVAVDVSDKVALVSVKDINKVKEKLNRGSVNKKIDYD